MSNEHTDGVDAVPTVDERDRRNFLKILGVAGSVGVASEFSLADVREAVGAEGSEELATMGQAIRGDLTGELDPDRLGAALGGIESAVAELPALREAGFPDEPTSDYAALTEPAWDAYEHLESVGLFEAAEQHLPEFTADHVRATTTELIRSEPLVGSLATAGLDERERTALVVDVVGRNERLANWVSTEALPANPDDYDPGDVAPLHQRAVGGSLLWIDSLDQHLWQREVLLTDAMLERGLRDVKRMLAGTYLLVEGVRNVADSGSGTLSDGQLTAALAAGSAVSILGQEDIEADLFRITDEERAPRGGVAE